MAETETIMPIKILNKEGHNSQGKLLPKAGAFPTGSYVHHGGKRNAGETSTFGIQAPAALMSSIPFGTIGRASIGTIAGRNLTATMAPNPNAGQFNLSSQPLHPILVSGPEQTGNPIPQKDDPIYMPWERPVIGVHNTRNLTKRAPVRTVFGASRTMPSDTAFHRKEKAVKKAGVPEDRTKDSTKFGPWGIPKQKSFGTRSNMWYDANNSYSGGHPQTANAEQGRGRWHVTKRGAAG
jgi:hypothetical protein